MEEDSYHYDFTTASGLEIFIARLEEIILEWGLHQKPAEKPLQRDDFKIKQWCNSSEIITFSEAEFILKRYYLKCDKIEEEKDEIEEVVEIEEEPAQAINDMLSSENDFFPVTNPSSKDDSHPIARFVINLRSEIILKCLAQICCSEFVRKWYGLRDFVVLIPQHSSYVSSESRIKVLLSSLSIAINNTKCAIPFFLMALEPWQNYFLGVFRSGSFQTEFNMVHLKKTPLHCKFLTGLLTMFKSKIGLSSLLNPVRVSVRFTYVLKDWADYVSSQEPVGFDGLGNDILGIAELSCLPFGSTYDSISELYLNALWPSILENSVVDSENYSDLDPLQAPIWNVSITTVDNPSCLLTDYYNEFVVLTRGKHSIRELLGNLITSNSNAKSSDMSSSLNALTESKISAFSKAVIGNQKTIKKEGRRQSQEAEGPISNEHLKVILYYLFPDADSNSKSPYSENLGGTLCNDLETEKKREALEKTLSGMKSTPFDSLLWRLSIVMTHVIHSLGGVRSAAYLWYEFTQELRFRWENGIHIPGLHLTFPDSRTCLLNQKLQLLNCCISKRIEREKRANEKLEENEEKESESEEEFYDCDADVNAEEEEKRRRKVKHALWDKPMGRLSRHGELKLLETGEPLYIPVTQDCVPKTEDQLEEDAEVLLQLGTDAQGSELRAKLMSASLLSDMEAFKAANPGCVLADFIRWYSPRDWVEEEEEELDNFGQRKGHLSKRMEIPGNTWVEVWQVAQPVPAKWQRRLFNDTRESEKVLDFLERKTPKEFIELLLPVMIVCVIQKLLEESAVDELPGNSEMLSKLIKKAEMLGRLPKISGNRYEELLNEISAVETMLVHARSLKHKFLWSNAIRKEAENQEDVMKFIKNLLTGAETEVPGGPKSGIGFTIRHYFSEATKAEQLILYSNDELTNEKWNVMCPFPSPQEKEMILRLSTVKGPQRLHAVLKKNECRLCGAFTRNIYLP